MMKTRRRKLEKRGESGMYVPIWFLLPLLNVNSSFPKPTKSPKNILNNNIQIWLIKKKILKIKQSPNITRKVVFSGWNFRAPDLETSKNKPNQIHVLELQSKECSRTSTVQVQQLQARFQPWCGPYLSKLKAWKL